MKTFKRVVRGTAKITGGLAGLVLLRAPFTNSGLVLMAGSIMIGLACVGGYIWAEPEDADGGESTEPPHDTLQI